MAEGPRPRRAFFSTGSAWRMALACDCKFINPTVTFGKQLVNIFRKAASKIDRKSGMKWTSGGATMRRRGKKLMR
jgi:hypothetical protein